MPCRARTFDLLPHPASPCPAATALTASVQPGADEWRLHYALRGALNRLHIPAPATQPQATDGLWQRTCFELFVGHGEGMAYHEFNFSPSGDWAGYRFQAERQRADGPALAPPRIDCHASAGELVLQVRLPVAALPASRAWRLGLTAVLQAADGTLSYWALQHPRPAPDFHHRAGWTAAFSAPKGWLQIGT